MNYLITKKAPDTRVTLCDIVIPDGFFVVMGLTFENQQQIKNIGNRYDVTETDLPEGHYNREGYRVTRHSILQWAYSGGKLDYVDKEPVASPIAPVRDQRPPDMAARPDYISIDEITVADNVVIPEGVLAARKILAEQGEQTAPAPERKEVEVPDLDRVTGESATEALQAAGATDEVAMLRAQLDVKGIKYHPTAQAKALRKKLEAA